ncbi:MAG: PqqD family protein [Paracoccaceae bacterium]|nr:PqqD family protein [Paracoccaceae bacterium]
MVHLDKGALRVLGLFDVRTREREVVDILSAAFPTVDAAQIENDVSGAVRRFRRAGLLVAT